MWERLVSGTRTDRGQRKQIHVFIQKTHVSIGVTGHRPTGMMAANVVFKDRCRIDGKGLVKNIAAIDPLALTPLAMSFWRWPEPSHRGAAIYLVMDRPAQLEQPLLVARSIRRVAKQDPAHTTQGPLRVQPRGPGLEDRAAAPGAQSNASRLVLAQQSRQRGRQVVRSRRDLEELEGGPATLFIDPIGRPASPTSVAGVHRRHRRRTRRRVSHRW